MIEHADGYRVGLLCTSLAGFGLPDKPERQVEIVVQHRIAGVGCESLLILRLCLIMSLATADKSFAVQWAIQHLDTTCF
ncbi:hypothetical protein FDV58_29510 [Bradyrhizobium elkanii]|uniref:Uncharacterized protein n=1 Tax=Bradyrhizobium elkanii TaxID=29448 RepID=A0A4U6RSB7_BRAEL|nr:hypothetical protein [Bradyrhizobium elkanii]TKV77739.1 hypothetical protein FDV58_29510 [Bradyrhizobium elkanii]